MFRVQTVAELVRLVEGGQSVEYTFFYGHHPEPDGRLGPGCLSQWWPAEFELDGNVFATAEHYMMWSKAVLFGDSDAAAEILETWQPSQAKRLGRQVRGFVEKVWRARRFEIVVRGNVAKFGQNAPLREFLLATGDRVLVEASPMDRVWGIGMAAKDPRAGQPTSWRGLNLLGFALMEARAVLRGA